MIQPFRGRIPPAYEKAPQIETNCGAFSDLCHGTRCGARTRKAVRPRDFKSLAFTNFATRARPFRISRVGS